MRYLNTLASSRTDATILDAKKKNRKIAVCSLAGIFMFFFLAGTTHAASPSPGWTVQSTVAPSVFSQSVTPECLVELAHFTNNEKAVCDQYEVTVRNAGSEATDGAPVVFTDTLPKGVTLERVEVNKLEVNDSVSERGVVTDCAGPSAERVVRCTYEGVVGPEQALQLFLYVIVNEGVEGSLPNKAEVSGGGLPSLTSEASAPVGSTAPPFGFSGFDFYKDGLNGAEEAQAGGHPYELTTTIELNSDVRRVGSNVLNVAQVGNPKDIVVNLPLGFAGSTLAAPECPISQLSALRTGSNGKPVGGCPPETIVGYITTEPESFGGVDSAIYNLVPERGYPAEFGYYDVLKGAHTFYVHVVPTPAGYVLQTEATDIPESNLRRITVTFYGDPALRDETVDPQVPFFTNPTACSNGPQVASIYMDAWEDPGAWRTPGHDPEITTGEVNSLSTPVLSEGWVQAQSKSPAVEGCNVLSFTPQIGSQPTTHEADKPTGLEFEQRLPQTENFGINATPALKDTTIVFPAGMTVDPSAADGLGVCSLAQIGYEGAVPAVPGELYKFSVAPPACPESSKIGVLELETPLLPGKIYGEVFLAAQNENPLIRFSRRTSSSTTRPPVSC